MKSISSINVLAVALLVVAAASLADAFKQDARKPNPRSCQEADMCCSGQNNTCFVVGARYDRSPDSKLCYCDSNCLIMGDCCLDYHRHCRSVDCEVGEWEEWTKCDNPCGFGTRRRRRGVNVFPDNGGNHCPVLKQRRACVGYQSEICSQNLLGSQEEEKNERGRILPLEFGKFRTMKKYDPWRGILKNLYKKYFNEIFTRATYQSTFRITATHYGCQKSDWASVLKVNETVCVECQPVAMNREIGMRCLGHGVYNAETKWKAVDVPHCHGKWRLQEVHKPETCQYTLGSENKLNFIFL